MPGAQMNRQQRLELCVRGDTHGCHILVEAEVAAIKAEYAANPVKGMKTELARKYGVHKATIYDIFAGRTWTHV